jgi:hypothetical protein
MSLFEFLIATCGDQKFKSLHLRPFINPVCLFELIHVPKNKTAAGQPPQIFLPVKVDLTRLNLEESWGQYTQSGPAPERLEGK